MEKKRIGYIDSLRGWAILGVILIHTRLFGPAITSPWLRTLVENGDKGVQLFFVLSGLSLCLSAQRRGLNDAKSIKEFFLRRASRILPFFYMMVVLSAWFYPYGTRIWYHGGEPALWWSLAATLTLVSEFSPALINHVMSGAWFVVTEVGMILMFPWLWKKIKNVDSAWWAFSTSLVLSRLLIWVLAKAPVANSELWGEYLYYFLPAQLPIFLLGIVAYWAMKEQRIPRYVYPQIVLMWVVDSWHNSIVLPYMWFGIVWLLLVTWLAKHKNSLIDNPLMQKLGGLSYEMYLVHFALFTIIARAGWSNLVGQPDIDALLRWVVVVVGSAAIVKLVTTLRSR